MCVVFACVCICAPHRCLVPTRRGHRIPWNWSYRQLWATTRVLGPGSSVRAAGALTHRVLSVALIKTFTKSLSFSVLRHLCLYV